MPTGLSEDQVSNERTGLVVGSGGASAKNQLEACDTLREKGVRRVGPYMVTRNYVLHHFGLLGDAFQDQGDQLLHQLCLRHFGSLYRSRG